MSETDAMHVYQPNKFTHTQVLKLKQSSGPSVGIDNFLTDDEFDFCRSLVLGNKRWPEVGKVSKYYGTSWEYDYGPDLLWLKEKIDKIIPNWELDFLALQEGITPWKIHPDIRWYADKIPYKVILIPLDVEPMTGPVEVNDWPDTYSIAFHQRDFLSVTRPGYAKTGNNQDKWNRPIDHRRGDPDEGFVDGYHISEGDWQKYFSHMPYSWAEGLTIDKIHRWRPKSLFYWDNNSLHCADNFLANNIRTKRCLMVVTNLKQ